MYLWFQYTGYTNTWTVKFFKVLAKWCLEILARHRRSLLITVVNCHVLTPSFSWHQIVENFICWIWESIQIKYSTLQIQEFVLFTFKACSHTKYKIWCCIWGPDNQSGQQSKILNSKWTVFRHVIPMVRLNENRLFSLHPLTPGAGSEYWLIVLCPQMPPVVHSTFLPDF